MLYWESNGCKHWVLTPLTIKSTSSSSNLYDFQPPQTQLVTSHHMERLIRKGAPAYVIQCQEMELLTCERDDCNHPKIQDLIQKHHKVF